jgi:hypothetical protein
MRFRRIMSQADCKNLSMKPSGPGALSLGMARITPQTSSSVNQEVRPARSTRDRPSLSKSMACSRGGGGGTQDCIKEGENNVCLALLVDQQLPITLHGSYKFSTPPSTGMDVKKSCWCITFAEPQEARFLSRYATLQ